MKFHMQLLQVKASQVRSSTFFRCFHSHSTGLRSGALQAGQRSLEPVMNSNRNGGQPYEASGC